MSAASDLVGDDCALLPAAGLALQGERHFYDGLNEAFAEQLAKARPMWRKELHNEYPAPPGLALDEVQALRFSRSFFQRNYETLKAKLEEELRLRILLAEIG